MLFKDFNEVLSPNDVTFLLQIYFFVSWTALYNKSIIRFLVETNLKVNFLIQITAALALESGSKGSLSLLENSITSN